MYHCFTERSVNRQIRVFINCSLEQVNNIDRNDYEFMPAVVVTLICRLYQSLSVQPTFPAAIIRDQRSYSPQLLVQACSVLGGWCWWWCSVLGELWWR